jgi:hypothetical protein
MANWTLTIGNQSPEHFARWLDTATFAHIDRPGFVSVIESLGYWQGERELSVVVTLWDVTEDYARAFADEYLRQHPLEDAIGLLPGPTSELIERGNS